MLLYKLIKNTNEKMPAAYGKYFAYPVITETINKSKLAKHMASHNTPFSPGAIEGMLTDMVACITELNLKGIAVKIDNLAIFSIGIKNKGGAATEKEFSVAKHIEGVKFRARATGDCVSACLNLEATLKKASDLTESSTSDGSGTSSGGNTPGGGSSSGSGSTSGGGGSSTPGSGSDSKGDTGDGDNTVE